jgi:hypothetical protein
MRDAQIAWVTHAPADYVLFFVADPVGDHVLVRGHFSDGDAAWDAAAGLEGAEISGAEVRAYCTLAGEADRVARHLSGAPEACTSQEGGTVEFVAVGGGGWTTAEAVGGDAEEVLGYLVLSRGGDVPRCYRCTEQCQNCGEFRGSVNLFPDGGLMLDKRELRCRCDGIPCRYCDTGVVRRPLSDHFDPERRAGHTPWFGYLVPCGACQAAGRGPRVVMSRR